VFVAGEDGAGEDAVGEAGVGEDALRIGEAGEGGAVGQGDARGGAGDEVERYGLGGGDLVGGLDDDDGVGGGGEFDVEDGETEAGGEAVLDRALVDGDAGDSTGGDGQAELDGGGGDEAEAERGGVVRTLVGEGEIRGADGGVIPLGGEARGDADDLVRVVGLEAEEALDEGAGEGVDDVAEVGAALRGAEVAGAGLVEGGGDESAAKDVPAIAGEAGLEVGEGEVVVVAGPEFANGPDAGDEVGGPDAVGRRRGRGRFGGPTRCSGGW
jgi:hypothetical protein